MASHDEQFPHTDITTEAAVVRARGARHRSRAWFLALCLGACLGAIACVGEVDSDDTQTDVGAEVETASSALVIMDEAPPAASGPCVVTDGPQKGMKGIYDSDGWCCSTSPRSNTCVECGDTAKCKATFKTPTSGLQTLTTTGAGATLAR
jgi:hypothetical protein